MEDNHHYGVEHLARLMTVLVGDDKACINEWLRLGGAGILPYALFGARTPACRRLALPGVRTLCCGRGKPVHRTSWHMQHGSRLEVVGKLSCTPRKMAHTARESLLEGGRRCCTRGREGHFWRCYTYTLSHLPGATPLPHAPPLPRGSHPPTQSPTCAPAEVAWQQSAGVSQAGGQRASGGKRAEGQGAFYCSPQQVKNRGGG